MKKNYYKLNLNGSYFWQAKDCIYTKRDYVSENSLLDDIFFKKLDDCTYQEVTTNHKLIFDSNGNLITPRGVIINSSSLTPVTSEYLIERYNRIKHSNLNRRYTKLILNLLRDSHYCELAKDKKESNKKLSRTF